MTRLAFAAAIIACGFTTVRAQQPTDHAPDRAAIQAAVRSYVEAYNRGDASAVASHWSETGEWVDSVGKRFVGREAIARAMQHYFDDSKGVTIAVDEPAIRFLTDDVAVEEGTATVTAPGEPPSESTYLAVHTKREGVWKLNIVRETETPPPSPAQAALEELSWMVGDWADSSPDSINETSVKWIKDEAFLMGTFRVGVPGIDDDLEGTQVIGWDPSSNVIRSWMFDSDGGFGGGVWTQGEGQWQVEFLQVLPDGRKASSVNIYTPVDADHYTWSSVNREVDGEALPDVEEVSVVRKSTAPTAIVGAAK